MGRLANKNILVTGGNSGIGLAAAQEFDREGARVAICGLNERSLQAAKETLGAGSLAVRADVGNLKDLDTMFATIKRELGHLDGVFVNAGYSEFLLFEEVTEQSFDKVIAVNFKGPYFTIQKALPLSQLQRELATCASSSGALATKKRRRRVVRRPSTTLAPALRVACHRISLIASGL
jgi:NAD(P)-dependent dehydrogenase (short-subunit alcohol dehydrogenase family)